MVYLSQRNPQWAGTKLGKSNLTVGRYGCTTTCISCLTDYFNCFSTPKELAEEDLKYTSSGLILWDSINKLPCMSFNERLYGRDDAKIMESLKDPDKACILQVNYGQHWILPLRKSLISNDYVCLDPWTGGKCLAVRDYHNITGMATFSRNKVCKN